MNRKRGLLLCLSIFVLLTFYVCQVSASVTFDSPQYLYYDDGTYVVIPPGTYNTVEKISNVWYVNGETFGANGGQSGVTFTLPFSNFYAALIIAGVIPIVLGAVILVTMMRGAKGDAEENAWKSFLLITALIATGVLLIIAAVVLGAVETAIA